MGTDVSVNVCLYDAIPLGRHWTVENDFYSLIWNVCHNDIISHHVSE